MTMKPSILVLLMLSTATFSMAHAQTYQWKDSNGRTVISDNPPPGNARQSKSVNAAPPAETGKSLAERDMEFKKRQQENREKSEKDAKESRTKEELKENCQRARQQLVALESGQRMSSTDLNGERRFMEDAERQKEIERSRKFIQESCK